MVDEITLTVLIPCYNEEESLPSLFSRLEALRRKGIPGNCSYAFMFVDDGSRDRTRSLIKDFSADREYVGYIFLSRNFGKEKAMFAGIENVETDAMVIIDADLQDPPELIPQMVELWRQGYDDVYARRRSRKGETWLKRATSHIYYSLLQMVSNVEIQKDTGDFRLLDSRCIHALRRLDESERNSKALFSWIGFKKIEFLYDRDERAAGRTKWNYLQLINLAIDGITSFTTAPLRLATYMGLLVSLAAFAYALFTFIRTLATGVSVPGYASLLIVTLLLGGVHLLCLGTIGEYLGRVFSQTKGRPNYLVQEEDLRFNKNDWQQQNE